MAVEVDVEVLSIADFPKAVEDATNDLLPELASSLRRMLRSRSESRWPVDTGRSVRSFYTDYGDQHIDIRNTARAETGFHYPAYLEFAPQNRHYRTIRRAIETHWDKLLRRAIRAAGDERVYG